MKCCDTPGCHVKTRREFEVEYYHQSLQWDKDGRVARQPILQQPLGFMAHTGENASETVRVGTHGALLTRKIRDVAEITVTKNANPGEVRLLLDYDARLKLGQVK